MKRRRMLLSGSSLKFFITYNGVIYEYKFAKGMTWRTFISSTFNDGNFTLNGTIVLFKGDGEVKLNGSYVYASHEITENSYLASIILTVYKPGDARSTVSSYGASWTFRYGHMLTWGSSNLRVWAETSYSVFVTVGPFDFSKYNTLEIQFASDDADPMYCGYHSTRLSDGNKSAIAYSSWDSYQSISSDHAGTYYTKYFNISGVTGTKYIMIAAGNHSGSTAALIKSIKLY